MLIRKRGISLIALVITIVITIIILSVTLQNITDRTNSAMVATHNTDITNLKEEATSYAYSHDGKLPVLLDTNGDYKVYNLVDGSGLQKEIFSCEKTLGNLYIIDLTKLGATSVKNGNGKDVDDYYIIADKSYNIYYAKGIKVNKDTYFGVVNDVTKSLIAKGTQGDLTGVGDGQGTPNPPKLEAGMVPQRFNGDSWEDTNTLNTDNEWYDYSNKSFNKNRWANVRLADGSQFVWIPRFTYKIMSGEHTDQQGIINIKFSNGTNDDTSDGYRSIPAFYWGGYTIHSDRVADKIPGGTELTGIWVAKYEPSDNNGKVQVKPGAISIKNISVSNLFTKFRNMQTNDYATYGILQMNNTIDVHMIKNSEWGAVAYLSKYALGDSGIARNDNPNFYTAGMSSVDAYKIDIKQSTTNNVYGIYDMSGGVWEYTASYINNGNANLTGNGASVLAASSEYKDVLPDGITDDSQANYDALKYAYGQAIYEVSAGTYIFNGSTYTSYSYAWYKNQMAILYGSYPWIIRGGDSSYVTLGIMDCLTSSGTNYNNDGSRVVIIVK